MSAAKKSSSIRKRGSSPGKKKGEGEGGQWKGGGVRTGRNLARGGKIVWLQKERKGTSIEKRRTGKSLVA